MENAHSKNTKNKIISSLNNFVSNINNWSSNSHNIMYDINLIVEFITRIIKELEVSCNKHCNRNLENKQNIACYKKNTLNNEKSKYEKIKHDVQIQINRKNQIEHYFNVVDHNIQYAMKKTIMKSEAIIVAAIKEHNHKMLNLELNSNSILLKIESNTKNNETEKNKRMIIRNNLQNRKVQIVQTYDSEMMEKHKNMNELNLKIKTIEGSTCQLQELISIQLSYYNKVIIEKKTEEDRIWQEKLYEIQRKIAVRKIQMHFRRYLNYIKTRDIKKNKKGQHKKLQSKIQKNV